MATARRQGRSLSDGVKEISPWLLNDMYSQPHAADPVLEERTVLDLVRRHGVHCSAVTRIDETGGEARTYMLDDRLVLKVQRPHRLRPRTSLAKEAFFLQQLAAYPDIVVPCVLGYGKHDTIEYIVMTQMPGVSALEVERTGVHRKTCCSSSGGPCDASTRCPRRLSLTARSSLGPAPGRHSWSVAGEPGPRCAGYRGHPRPLAARRRACGPGVPGAGGAPASIDLVALHSNPGPVHTFVQPETRAFVGLIDFGDAYISHPALDWRWPTHADRVALLHGYCDDTPVKRRVSGRLARRPGAQ